MHFKLDNVSDLTMARWAAAEGFTYLTFNFEKGSGYEIKPHLAREIRQWVTGPLVVARIGKDESGLLEDLYNLIGFDCIETDPETFASLSGFEHFPCIIRLKQSSIPSVPDYIGRFSSLVAFQIEGAATDVPTEFIPRVIVAAETVQTITNSRPYGVYYNAGAGNETDFDFFDFFEKNRYEWTKNAV